MRTLLALDEPSVGHVGVDILTRAPTLGAPGPLVIVAPTLAALGAFAGAQEDAAL